MNRPRVLLVDDDASIRRLVALTLEDEPLELVSCASGAEALERLREAPVQLLITDLMMPGISGFELLERLAADPALRGGARLAVFSAGLGAEVHKRLAGLPVWRRLNKPMAVAELLQAVHDALADAAPDAAPDAAAAPAARDETEGEAAAIAEFFGGDAALFAAFRDSCRLQFADDLLRAEAAVAARDAVALRHLAHSLKSVLLTLGEPVASAQARTLEQAMAAGDWDAGAAPWGALQQVLQRRAGSGV